MKKISLIGFIRNQNTTIRMEKSVSSVQSVGDSKHAPNGIRVNPSYPCSVEAPTDTTDFHRWLAHGENIRTRITPIFTDSWRSVHWEGCVFNPPLYITHTDLTEASA